MKTRVWRLVLHLVVVLFLLMIGFGDVRGAEVRAAPVAPRGMGQQLHKKVIVVLIDGLRLSDLTPDKTPYLWRMQQFGAVGVMSQNTLGPRDEMNSYLTIGAGAKASAPFSRAEAFGVQERIKEDNHVVSGRDLYWRDLGSIPTGAIVVPQLPQIMEQASKAHTTILPGLLGDAVEQLGGKTAVLGNSDLGLDVQRPAALLAMNSRGTVDLGDLHAGLRADPARPYGMRTDMDTLFRSYEKLSKRANFIVLETGDLIRLHHAARLMEAAQVAQEEQTELREADQLVGRLLPEAGADTMLAVISPTKTADHEAPPLAPVLFAGGGLQPGGVLTSGTTKRAGLVTNYDLAPTFVHFLGGDPRQFGFLGEPLLAQTAILPGQQTSHFQSLSDMVSSQWVASRARNVMVRPWINLWITLTALSMLISLFRRPWLRYLQPLADVLLILPLAWLYVPLYAPHSVGETVLLAIGVALAICLLIGVFRDRMTRLAVLAELTVLTLLVDVLLGAPLEKQAVLSYDPIAGARYYGVGNEYMGVLLGAALLWLNAMYSRQQNIGLRGRVLALLLFVFIVYVFAAPALGTNFGGALAAAVGFTYAMLEFSEVRLSARHGVLLGVVCLGVVLVMIVLNVFLPSTEQTHIGRAMHQLFNGEYAAVWQIAARKLQLNFLLLRVSAWGKLLLLLGVVLLVNRLRKKTVEKQMHAVLSRNSRMVLVTALAALLLNDSGVVAAALALLYAIVPLIAANSAMERATPVQGMEDTEMEVTPSTH